MPKVDFKKFIQSTKVNKLIIKQKKYQSFKHYIVQKRTI